MEQYLIFAEGRAMQRIPMYMQDWIDKLNAFLQINNKKILEDAGKISHELAKEIAEKEYNKFRNRRAISELKDAENIEKLLNISTKISKKINKK